MATKKTTKTTTKKATKPAATKSELGTKVRNRVIGMQQRTLEMQESAFDRTYDAVNSVQERAEDRLHGWLDKTERVPTEAKKIVAEWIGFNQEARKGYRSAVAKSFDLSQKWFEGMKKTA